MEPPLMESLRDEILIKRGVTQTAITSPNSQKISNQTCRSMTSSTTMNSKSPTTMLSIVIKRPSPKKLTRSGRIP
jgi:hypothetical protein